MWAPRNVTIGAHHGRVRTNLFLARNTAESNVAHALTVETEAVAAAVLGTCAGGESHAGAITAHESKVAVTLGRGELGSGDTLALLAAVIGTLRVPALAASPPLLARTRARNTRPVETTWYWASLFATCLSSETTSALTNARCGIAHTFTSALVPGRARTYGKLTLASAPASIANALAGHRIAVSVPTAQSSIATYDTTTCPSSSYRGGGALGLLLRRAACRTLLGGRGERSSRCRIWLGAIFSLPTFHTHTLPIQTQPFVGARILACPHSVLTRGASKSYLTLALLPRRIAETVGGTCRRTAATSHADWTVETDIAVTLSVFALPMAATDRIRAHDHRFASWPGPAIKTHTLSRVVARTVPVTAALLTAVDTEKSSKAQTGTFDTRSLVRTLIGAPVLACFTRVPRETAAVPIHTVSTHVAGISTSLGRQGAQGHRIIGSRLSSLGFRWFQLHLDRFPLRLQYGACRPTVPHSTLARTLETVAIPVTVVRAADMLTVRPEEAGLTNAHRAYTDATQ